MTRISKQEEKRRSYPRKRKPCLSVKTGPIKENLPLGYKPQENAIEGDLAKSLFIPRIK